MSSSEPQPTSPSASVFRPVAKFALAGLAALAVFLVGSLVVLRLLGESEALRDARQFATLSGQGIVEPVVQDEILDGDARAVAAVERVVQERVLGERIVRVKVWTRDGRIVYSDEPRLIGAVHPLDASKLEVLETGEARAELSGLDGPENRFEQGLGELYEVYLPIRTPDGTPLLFETYQASSEVTSTGRRIWLPFAALLLASLVLLWLVQVPLAWGLGDRLRRSQREREELLTHAIEASADERRRIAGELHDGVVQELAGISYSLSAAADRAPPDTRPDVREALQEGAAGTRDSMRRIRSLLVDIHPPNLRATGLDAALSDLLTPLATRGIETSLSIEEGVVLDAETEQLVYRTAAEAIRNVEKHADATKVSVRYAASDGQARLDVEDDGRGVAEDERARSRAGGHVGLSLLDELALRRGGTLEVASSPGVGTRVSLVVPA